MIGSKLANRYEVTGELGRGGMGVVYRALDPLLNREVAIKLVPPTMLTAEAEERFQREAQVVAQMDHPGIVQIYDIGRHEGALFFLMPIARGVTLRSLLRDRTLRLGEVIDIGIQVAEALDYSHSRGVIHRDIKPENIMVSREEDGGVRCRVMDFGLARAASENRLTKTGTIVGTLSYFSPEQVTSTDVDSRSDIYSLATVLYECLAGDPPFTGEMQAMIYRIVHENPVPLRSAGANIGEELEDIIMQGLRKEPIKRPQRAMEIAESLRRYRAKLQEEDRAKSIVYAPADASTPARVMQSPFVGREKEFAELQRRLNAAASGECQFAVVAGEPGIGKTRLFEELESLAKARRIRVLHGRFVEQDRAFSYQGFCEVIQEYFRSKETASAAEEHPDFSDLAADLTALFPVLNEIAEIRAAASGDGSTARPETRKAEDRTAIFELLARTLTRIARGRPLLLILENLHGADVSIEALQYIVRRLGSTATLVVGSYRQNEIDKRHPLARMIDGFSDDPRFVSLTLPPLSLSEHRTFLESIVGSIKLADGLAQRLFEASEANPFFTKELVRSLLDSGSISKDATGAWSLSEGTGISTEALPATIQQAVEKRVERLPENLREILSVASVLGKTFEFRDLESLAEDKADPEEAVEKLIREGLIEEERESRGDRLTFSSGIVRDVLYSALSRRKRKSVHRKYAEQLEKRNAGRLDRVYPQLVHHFSQGDVPEKTVDYGLKMARKSLDTFSPEETVRTIKTVLEFLEDEDWGGERALQAEARLMLSAAHRMGGSIDSALKEAETAVKIFEEEKQKARAASAALLAAETAWQGRRIEPALRWLEHGIEAARRTEEPETLGKLLSLGATLATLRGDYGRAKDYLEEAERLTPAKEKETAEETPAGGRLVVALANPVRAREPGGLTIGEETEVLANVFETLLANDAAGGLIPNLCERWDVLEDGKSFLLSLRPGVRFQDGAPLTAEDVKKSFERAIRKGQRTAAAFSSIRGIAEFLKDEAEDNRLAGIVVRSETAFEIQLQEALPIYPALLTALETAVVRLVPGGEDPYVFGTGPFRITSYTPERVVLEKNAGYWRGMPARLDSIEFRVAPSASAIAAGLRGGEFDLARDLLPEDLEELLREPRFRSGLVESPKKITYFALFNMAGPTAENADVRHALCDVVRTHNLVGRTLGRFAQPAAGLIPPGILGHDPGKRRRHIDRDEAVKMLRGTGLTMPIRLRAAVHPLMRDRYGALTGALFDLWEDIGVEVRNETTTIQDYIDRNQNSAAIDMKIGRYNADYDDPDNFTYGLFNSTTGTFRNYFSSPAADKLLEEARVESRPAMRETLYRRFESLLAESAILLPLFHEIDYRLASPNVRGLRLRPSVPYVNYPEIGKTEQAAPVAALRTGGGIIHVPIAGVVYDLDPTRTGTVEQSEVSPNIFETLIRGVEGARLVPWLVSDYRAEEGGKRFRFLLREDVRFHDGRRLTARDVRYSYERLLANKESASRWVISPIRGAQALSSGEARELEGFHILSATEFTIDLEKPLAFFPAMISYPAAAIVPEGTEKFSGNWREQCVGTGPFRIVRFEPGRELELERNPHYWRAGFPKSDGLVFHFDIAPEEILADFRAGKLSLASDLFPSDVENFRHDSELASGYRETPRLSTYFAAFNVHRGPLADAGLRRALIAAVDVEGIVRRTIGRLAIPAHGLIPPGLLGYAPQSPRPSASGSSILSGKRPAALKIELSTSMHPVFFGQYSLLAREISDAFADVGVTLNIVTKTMPEYLQTHVGGSADLLIGRWLADYPDADTFVHGVLHSKEGNMGRFCGTPAIDRLGDRGRTEIDPAVRHTVYRQVEEIVAREALMMPLFHEQVYRFARPEVEGLTINFSQPEVAYDNLRIRR